MSNKVGIVVQFNNSFDLSPFPEIPAGALYTGDMYLIGGALQSLIDWGATEVNVLVDAGAVYIGDAVSRYELYKQMSVKYYADFETQGLAMNIRSVLEESVNKRSSPVAVLPANILTNLSLDTVERNHRTKGRPPVTVVVVQGEDEMGIVPIPGYRMTQIMLVEKSLVKYLKEGRPLGHVLSILHQEGKVNFFCFDDFLYEVNTEEDFLMMRKPPER
jgi:NDP-sugar pyrophosphorylase family protein